MSTPDPRIVQLDKYYEQLKTQRQLYESLWRDIITYVRPLRTSPLVVTAPGQSQTTAVFDSTAIHSVTSLASSMHGSLTSNAAQWYSLRMRLEELNEDQPTQVWLETCASRIFRAIQASNFGAEGIEGYLDLAAFGISATLLTESSIRVPGVRFAGLEYKTIGLGTYVIAEGMDGTVNTFARCFAKPAAAVKAQWPEAVKMSDDLRLLVENTPFEPVEIVHAIYPRELYGAASAEDPKPYASVYWIQKDKTLLGESGYWEFPVLVPRWAKSDQETYGRGPGSIALYDVKTLNRAKELGLKAWDKGIDPPMKALAEGVVGSVRMTPGGITYVQDMNGLQPLVTGAMQNLQWTQVEVAALRSQIKETFYNSETELPNQPYMTAEEVIRRYELMERKLGPTLGRLESEFLAPMIRRIFLMLFRAGLLPAPPPKVLDAMKAGISEIDIQYEGPLSRSQRFTEVQSIQKTMAFVKPIWEVRPEVLDNFRFDDIVRKGAVDAGLPAAMLEESGAVNQLRKDRAKIRDMQAKLQADQAKAQAAASMGQAAQAGAQAQATLADLPNKTGAPPQNAA